MTARLPALSAARLLWLRPEHRASIEEHAESTYPEECCGVLIGRARLEEGNHASPESVVQSVRPTSNVHPGDRRHRYAIRPAALLAAHQEARAAGLDVVGYYHSHPDHAAVPSARDRATAWPGCSYVIIALAGGKVTEMRSWRLTDDREQFEEETIRGLP